jgi:hypothetical protein
MAAGSGRAAIGRLPAEAKKKKMRMTVLEMTGFIRKEDMVFSRARFARTR